MARAVNRLHSFDLECARTLLAVSKGLPEGARQRLNVLRSKLQAESAALKEILESDRTRPANPSASTRRSSVSRRTLMEIAWRILSSARTNSSMSIGFLK